MSFGEAALEKLDSASRELAKEAFEGPGWSVEGRIRLLRLAIELLELIKSEQREWPT